MKIGFIWQGLSGRYGHWQDGLWAAMKLIEEEHEVRYFDFPLDGIHDYKPDVVLYWEAPCTINGKDADNYNWVCDLPFKKALLFAGGPLKAIDVKDFDLVFVESKVNEEDCERQGIPYRRAFGVNTQIMKPMFLPKIYDGFMQATFAAWKRHDLFARSVGPRGAVAGRRQECDMNGYDLCVKLGVKIFSEMEVEGVSRMINSSHCVLNTSNEQGGGQRCTLEAMACNVPVIVMSDSPKNCEYVHESGAGLICDPDAGSIQMAIQQIKDGALIENGREYIKSNWTERQYADALLEGIDSIV